MKPYCIRWRKGDTVTALLLNAESMERATAISQHLLGKMPELAGFKVDEVEKLICPIAAEAVGAWSTFTDPPLTKAERKKYGKG